MKTYEGVRKIVANSSTTSKEINSTIYVGEGVTSQLEFHGGSGNDNYYLDGGSTTAVNLITGDAGNDIIIVGASAVGRRFRIEGGEGTNELEGGPGADEIIGGSGVNFMKGNGGSDVIRVGGGINYILGDEGTMSVPPGDSFAPRISTSIGAYGDDIIQATSGTNYILGGLGDDRIQAGGINTVVGDEGTLWFSKWGQLERVSTNPSRMDSFYGNGFGNSWVLPEAPLNGAATVSVSGTLLEKFEYRVSGNSVILGRTPLSGMQVTVTYSVTNSGLGGDDTMVASSALVGASM
jgi:Ca2+-binding RTX toxin-like protein